MKANQHNPILLLSVVLALAPLAWPPPSAGQITIIPGSARHGADLFREKGCIQCHAFNGKGGDGAPDLSQKAQKTSTPMLLAAALWNHGPTMWAAQRSRQIQPTLDSTETADLFAYFYSLSYFNTPGDAGKGKVVFEKNNCTRCHAGTGQQPGIGPGISTSNEVQDPIRCAERMWNHSGKMYEEMVRAAISWPSLSSQNIVDLIAYFRSMPEARSQSAAFQPGDPELGRLTFESRCESCHSFGTRTAERKIDLLKAPGPHTMTDYASAMWNHAPLMHKRAGSDFPILAIGEMGNLVAYLFAQRYFYEEGDAARGARVFQDKNCALCHEQQRQQTGAPDLTLATERYSPITMSGAVWRHGPAMFEKMRQQNLVWPQLSGPEMSNLIAYLNSRLVQKNAN